MSSVCDWDGWSGFWFRFLERKKVGIAKFSGGRFAEETVDR